MPERGVRPTHHFAIRVHRDQINPGQRGIAAELFHRGNPGAANGDNAEILRRPGAGLRFLNDGAFVVFHGRGVVQCLLNSTTKPIS